MVTSIVYKDLAFAVIGACFEVYNDKGFGFVEPVFQECLELELATREIDFVAQPRLLIEYKGRPLHPPYIPDLLIEGKIIVEIKAVRNLLDEHRTQTLNYLKATGHRLGRLINFSNREKLEWERIVL